MYQNVREKFISGFAEKSASRFFQAQSVLNRAHITGYTRQLMELFKKLPVRAQYIWSFDGESEYVICRLEREGISYTQHSRPFNFIMDMNPFFGSFSQQTNL